MPGSLDKQNEDRGSRHGSNVSIDGDEDMVAEELRRCPFCGGEPKLKIKERDREVNVYHVQCYSCGTRSRKVVSTDFLVDSEALDEAKALWNSRVSPS